MSTVDHPERTALPALVEGLRLDQPTFHERYEAMPPGTRVELIGGVVSVPGPVGYDHSDASICVVLWLSRYQESTPGVQALDNATVVLDRRNEPQPDAALRVRPEYGGRTRNQGRFVAGAPELLVEVARSSPFIVRSVEPDEVLWYVLDGDRFVENPPGEDGLIRSRAFPGLWLDPAALLAGDRAGVRAALDRGLGSPGHTDFVARLAAARGPA